MARKNFSEVDDWTLFDDKVPGYDGIIVFPKGLQARTICKCGTSDLLSPLQAKATCSSCSGSNFFGTRAFSRNVGAWIPISAEKAEVVEGPANKWRGRKITLGMKVKDQTTLSFEEHEESNFIADLDADTFEPTGVVLASQLKELPSVGFIRVCKELLLNDRETISQSHMALAYKLYDNNKDLFSDPDMVNHAGVFLAALAYTSRLAPLAGGMKTIPELYDAMGIPEEYIPYREQLLGPSSGDIARSVKMLTSVLSKKYPHKEFFEALLRRGAIQLNLLSEIVRVYFGEDPYSYYHHSRTHQAPLFSKEESELYMDFVKDNASRQMTFLSEFRNRCLKLTDLGIKPTIESLRDREYYKAINGASLKYPKKVTPESFFADFDKDPMTALVNVR